MVLSILLLVATGLTLYKDLSRDKGAYVTAKVTQVLAVSYVVVNYASTVTTASVMVRHFSAYQAKYQVPMGGLSAELNFASILVQEVLGLILLFAAFSVARRLRPALVIFRIVLLLMIPTAIAAFYRGFTSQTTMLPPWLVWLLGGIISGGINLVIVYLYGRPYMRDFFSRKAVADPFSTAEPPEP